MGNWVYLLLLVIIVFIFIRWRNNQSTTEVKTKPLAPRSGFHCVHIRYPANACLAVKGLSQKRFLASEAPSLPVPGCTVEKCECRFIHHEDRRIETLDRRNERSLSAQIFPEDKNKRDSSSRRDETEMDEDHIL